MSILLRLQHWFVGAAFGIFLRGLNAASQVDPVSRQEVAGLPEGLLIELTVFPDGPGRRLIKRDGVLQPPVGGRQRAGLQIQFKHLAHALLLVTLRENAHRAFAHNRIILSGDTQSATRLMRCIDRLHVLLLPRFLARRGVAEYPDISLGSKLRYGAKVYLKMFTNLLAGLFKRGH